MIYGISDLHLDYTKKKDMAVFGGLWEGYEEKIFENWKVIEDSDLVLIPGDISWQMSLNEARGDLHRLDELPGTKLLSRGNHDYWWPSIKKFKGEDYKSLKILQNDCFVWGKLCICGTRGWEDPTSPDFTEEDEKIFKREEIRLSLSLDKAPEEKEIWVMLHYPPFDSERKPNSLARICEKRGVKKIFYGHLHGQALKSLVEVEREGIEYTCLSADYLNFKPKLLGE